MCQQQHFAHPNDRLALQPLLIHWDVLLSLSLKCFLFSAEVINWNQWGGLGHDNWWRQMASEIIVLATLRI